MRYRKNKIQTSRAMTLVETLIAMAIMGIIFAALLPQLKIIQNNWESKVGASETLQNGRVLIVHLNRNLSKASRITAVSDSSEINGYIEFIDNDANSVRYDVNSISDYVEFGLIGNLSDLAGPVSQLQFTCYDSNDFTTPITDVNSIRFVKVQTTLSNSAMLDQDKNFTTNVYIRTNDLPAPSGDITKRSEPWLVYETTQGKAPALLQINPTKYLCAYQGLYSGGFASILTVDNINWSVSKGSAVQYDADYADTPTLAKIDSNHFLCAYEGYRGDGWVCVLAEESNILILKSSLEFNDRDGLFPSLYQVDATHYLCAYQGTKSAPTAVILTVDTSTWNITSGTPIEFDSLGGTQPALAKVDDTHYLCVYNGFGNGGAIILTIDTVNWTISQETPFYFEIATTEKPALTKVDDTHYICTYTLGNQNTGWGVIFTVNTSDWTITQEIPVELESVEFLDSVLCKMNNTDFLCGYTENSPGRAVVLTVDTSDWTITKGTMLDFEAIYGGEPALCQIDTNHYLCAYYDSGSSGIAGVLELGEEILP